MAALAEKLIISLAFLVNILVGLQYFVHMLQLNSYRNERYCRWLSLKAIFSLKRSFVLLALPALLIKNTMAAALVFALIFLLHAFANRPLKAKKPLVYTARVKRLLLAFLLIALVLARLFCLAGLPLGGLICVAAALFSPLLLILANLLAAPVEKAVVRYYYNDAKKKLEAMPRLLVIGVTGSYGKTSTKQYLHQILSQRFNVLSTPESYNTTLGVVRAIRERLLPVHEVFIVEMGARQAGDIKEICRLVSPGYGLITSIAPQHLETFKSIDNIINTKFELCDSLPPEGICFANFDNEHIRQRAAASDKTIVSYGLGSDWDYHAGGLSVGTEGSSFWAFTPDGASAELRTKLLGAHNIQNLMGAIAVAHKLGVSLDRMAYPIRAMSPVKHRLELLKSGGNISYIDDAYNSNPEGARAALEVLSGFKGLRVLLTPGMVELGDMEDELNFDFGRQAASACDFVILVGKEQTASIYGGLAAEGFPSEKIYVAGDLQDALARVKTLPADGHIYVLLENDLPDNYL